MECEVKKEVGGGDSTPSLMISALEEQVQLAADQLLLTNFPACLEVCRRVVAAAGDWNDCDTDVAGRLNKVRESATVIGIQALAEQGKWRGVIPFVEQVYSHMAACPPAIMQMCLLLHAHVKEYMVCHSLINSWLEWEDHRHHSDSGAIVSIYVNNVLAPLRAYNLIPQVVERCTALSPVERQALLSPRTGSPRRASQSHVPSLTDQGNITENSDTLVKEYHTSGKGDKNESKGSKIVSMYMTLARKLWRSFAKKGWCQHIRRASKLFFLISFVLLALVHVQTDVTAHFSRAMEIWKTAFGTLFNLSKQQPQKNL